jgi:hypothetical protein
LGFHCKIDFKKPQFGSWFVLWFAPGGKNLFTGKIFLSYSAKYSVLHMKMVRIFQQWTNCSEISVSVDTVAGLVNRFGSC